MPLNEVETRFEWEARTGKTLTWDDILPDSIDPACMLCGSTVYDAESTDGFEWGVEPGTLWTFCPACDCWTEHPPRYREPPPKESEGR